jgi:hypothetical protein
VSEPYEEILEGRTFTRPAPGVRHELICQRLHSVVKSSTANMRSTRLLESRSRVQVSLETFLRPDLALVTAATGKLWLAAEIVSSEDHHADTVIKKEIYETAKIPRLWMVDPRYDNVEIYHASPHGLILKHILAGKEVLTEQLLPEFELSIAELFSPMVTA